MEGVDRGGKWKSLKERLGFVGLGCCVGTTWGTSNMRVREEDDEEQIVFQPAEGEEEEIMDPGEEENGSGQDCLGQNDDQVMMVVSGMNLATALAAERHFRTTEEELEVGPGGGPGIETPSRKSLMRLLEESDGCDEKEKVKEEKGSDVMCCVCMGRKKGAAFIPCGHTFCRVCSREIWLNRGSCPLCNRLIVEVLDIF